MKKPIESSTDQEATKVSGHLKRGVIQAGLWMARPPYPNSKTVEIEIYDHPMLGLCYWDKGHRPVDISAWEFIKQTA
jgi:hypothetical protein